MKFLRRTQMIRITLLLFSLGLIAFAMPALADSEPVVMLINVTGNPHIPAEKILSAVQNTKIGEPVDSQKLQDDMQAIMGLGCFSDVKVSTQQIYSGIKVEFNVVENPLFKEVQITGLTQINPTDLKPYFTQKQGEVINTALFKEDLAKALKYCREKKSLFIEPKIDQLAITADGVIKIELVEMRYGKIKIQGLVKTKEFVVRRELTIKEGDIINYDVLKDNYMKLMRLRLFDSIDPSFENGTTSGTLDLVFTVKEAQNATFSIGASYSENTGELGALLGLSDPNLMGTGQSFSMDLNYSKSHKNVKFSFVEPWLDSKHTSFSLSVWNSDTSMTSTMRSWYPSGYTNPDLPLTPGDNPLSVNQTYDLNLIQTGLSFGFGRPLGKYTTAGINFSFEKNNINKYWLPDGTDHQDSDGNDLPSLKVNSPANPFEFWDNSISLSLDTNRLSYKDSNFVNGGYEVSMDYTGAGKYFGGYYNYNRLTVEGKWFTPLSSQWVWGTRIQGAFLKGTYPDYDVLYMGGMYKLRGYDDRKFYNSDTINTLGERYVIANTELRWQPTSLKGFEFAGFYDFGIADPLSGKTNYVVKSDFGVGFRYNIPFLGLLRIDQAWNRDKDNKLVVTINEAF